jgi:plastocyanin
MLMKITLLVAAVFCGALFVASGPCQSTNAADTPAADVTGEVSLIQEQAGHSGDASHVVVWLTPVDAQQRSRAMVEKTHYRLVQRNKRFEPSLLVVPVGSIVDFPNADPWFHNVFSLYRGKRFDLGLYQAGAQRSVKFDRIGPSYLFCNIHPEMTGVVLAIDSEFFAISDKAGHYSISGVPPGKYILQVWYENARPEALQELQHTVALQGGTHTLPHSVALQGGTYTLPPISIPVVKQIQIDHKNKYGQEYDPNTLKNDY